MLIVQGRTRVGVTLNEVYRSILLGKERHGNTESWKRCVQEIDMINNGMVLWNSEDAFAYMSAIITDRMLYLERDTSEWLFCLVVLGLFTRDEKRCISSEEMYGELARRVTMPSPGESLIEALCCASLLGKLSSKSNGFIDLDQLRRLIIEGIHFVVTNPSISREEATMQIHAYCSILRLFH